MTTQLTNKLLQFINAKATSARKAFEEKPGTMALSISAFASLMFLLVLLFLPTKPPLVLIDAKTEFLRYTVVREGLANIVVENAAPNLPLDTCKKLLDDDGLFTGMIIPKIGAKITYRQVDSLVVVDITGKDGGLLVGYDKSTCTLPTMVRFKFERGDGTEINASGLPIVGPAEIGIELGFSNAPEIGRPKGRWNIGTWNRKNLWKVILGEEQKLTLPHPVHADIYPNGK